MDRARSARRDPADRRRRDERPPELRLGRGEDRRDARDDVLAFDVGGANIKAADGLGWVHSEPFELWRRRQLLPAALERIILDRRPHRVVATMTGEIADCYPSRAEGVADIVAALVAAATTRAGVFVKH